MKLLNSILKWLAALAFAISAGLLVIIFLSGNPQINAFLLRILILLAIGFTGGLLMRILFRKGFAIIQVVTAFLTNLLSVLAIDYFFESEYTLSFLSKEFTFSLPLLTDYAQATLLLIISLPALLLFRKKRVKKVKRSEPERPPGPSFSDRIKVTAYQVNPKNWNIKLPTFQQKKSSVPKNTTRTSSKKRVQVSSSAGKSNRKQTHIKSKAKAVPSSRKIKLPKLNKHSANNDVKLMGEEDHVCPYCLEEVVKNDTRGVAICPECHTWHHQDCWDVTGACGVAHRNKL